MLHVWPDALAARSEPELYGPFEVLCAEFFQAFWM